MRRVKRWRRSSARMPAGLAFVPNATAGVNAVLRSLDLDKFDELLVTTHEYNASRNALDYVAGLAGAKVVVADVPFPIDSAEVVIERVMDKVTDRTRLLLIDHVTSQTALILPIERLVQELAARGIDTLVDGAHAPGLLPLDLTRDRRRVLHRQPAQVGLRAERRRVSVRAREPARAASVPSSISHGANATRTDRSRFLLEFDWTGTFDPTAWLCVPHRARVHGRSHGGWPEVMRRNHALALLARDLLCDTLGIDRARAGRHARRHGRGSASRRQSRSGRSLTLQDLLLFEHDIEVPIVPWPHPPKRLLRVSAQLYNEPQDYGKLCTALLLHLR